MRQGLLRRRGLLGLGMGVLVGLTLVMILSSQAMAGTSCPTGDDIYTGSGSWWTASNWSTGAWPSPSQVACWTAGQTVTVAASGSTATAAAITAQGDLIISGGSLGMPNSSTGQSTVANLTMTSGGSLCGPPADTLSFSGNFDWNGAGSLNTCGDPGMTIQQQGSGSFKIEGSGQAYIGPGPLEATGPVSITNPGFANYNAAVTSSLITPGVVTLGPGSYGGSVVGTTFVSAGGLATSNGSTDLPNWALTLTGSASSLASSGELSVVNLTTNPNTTLTVPGGYTLNDGGGQLKGTIDGGGTVNIAEDYGGSNVELFGGGALTKVDLALPCGGCAGRTLTVDSGATFSPSAVDIAGGSLVVDQSSQVGDLTLNQGGLSGPSGVTLTFTGNFDWNPSQAASSYDYCSGCQMVLQQQGSGSFKIEGTNGATVGNGAMNATGPVSISNPSFGEESTVDTFTLTTPGVLSVAPNSYGGNPIGVTAGSLAISPGTGTASTPWNLTLTGGSNGQMTTDIPSGDQIGAWNLYLTGGTLQGTGTVATQNLDNSGGTVMPGEGSPGTLTINGGYAQESGGSLLIPADGTGAGQYSVVAVTGPGEANLNGGTVTLEPSQSYANSANPNDTFGVLTYQPNNLTGQFTSGGSNPPLRDGEPVTADYSHNGVVNLVVGAAPAPQDNSKPTISGNPVVGQTLTCNPGSWSPTPTSYAYGWNRDGNAISGATSQQYTAASADQGHQLTCTVTASNGGTAGSPATSDPVTVSAAPQPPPVQQPPAQQAPKSTSPPTISGTALPGDTLTCNPGTWSGNPTSFGYQWTQDSSNISGATQQQYAVQIADEGHSLGCGVTAGNGAGQSAASASAPVIVAVKGTLSCPKPSGQIGGSSVGPLSLGMRQTRARGTLKRFAVTSNHFDDFCLYGGWGIRAGYPSSQLLHTLPRGERTKLSHQIVIALTANPFYSLNGVRPGASLATAKAKLHLSQVFHIGLNDWYVAAGIGPANGVLKIRGGVVQEVGLVNKQLTRNRKAQSRLLTSFG